MRAISIRQPWAWLVINGIKTVENRTWNTNIRGRTLIHASNTLDITAGGLAELRKDLAELEIFMPTVLDLGGIVGMVDITDCTLHPILEEHKDWHEPGMYAWLLDNAQPLPFIPYKGKLNFFEVPDELIYQRAPRST